jgi:YVTN family beta-propeller protein
MNTNGRRTLRWLAAMVLGTWLSTPAMTQAGPIEIGHPTFLSPHASPIVLHGEQLFVTNTAADTVDVINIGNRSIVSRIHVGIDPVALAVRPDGREIWVSNHVSDSVSVIDADPASRTYLQVIATVQDIDPVTRATRFDEPVGIAFAGNDKAYVALSSENQIAVINVATREVVRKLDINAQDPRAIRVRNGRLYVIPFESNNQTQISGCVDDVDPQLCTFDATEHVINNNNVLSRNAVVDIVRNPEVPDRDLYVFETANDQLVEVVESLGTLLYGLVVDSGGRVFIAQTDARNDANGRAGTFGDGLDEMENRAFLNQVTRIDCNGLCGQAQFIDLEPLPPVDPAPGLALATPFAIEISADDTTLVLSAAGSDMLFTVDAGSGDILGRVAVGSTPRGIALYSDGAGRPSQAWVFNAVANTVSLVDVSDAASPRVDDTIDLVDPTHPVVKRGRMAFNDAGASTTGTFSCESCHPDGGTDQLLWVLDTPLCDLAGCTQIPPRVTMPIRGLRDTAPYHWDGIPGDPYGGINTANIRGYDVPNCSRYSPESCTRFLLDGSLATTLCETGTCPVNEEGKAGALTAAERDDMARFLLSVPYPPAQRRSYTNVLSDDAVVGFRLFHIDGDLQGNPEPNVCGDCHRMPFWVSTNTPGTGMEAPTWRGAYDRWLILPQGRLNLIDFDFFRNLTDVGVPERGLWRLSWVSRPRFDPVWDMVLEGSTGFSGAFARQVTLNQNSVDIGLTVDLLENLEQSAAEGAIVLQGEGVIIQSGENGDVARPVALQYDDRRRGGGYVQADAETRVYSRAELISLAAGGRFVGTFTGRLGANVDVDHPQPAIWSPGPIEEQRGRQEFPTLYGDGTTIRLGARHLQEGANIYVDGRRVPGYAACLGGELPNCHGETIEVQLAARPTPAGIHLLQIQNPDGLFSNDYIIHSADAISDNCPDIPNPDQADSDGDGTGDRCDDDAFDFTINPGISGNWFDPEHDGEGWFVEILNESQALVYWFSYTPPAVGGEQAQAWIGGLGEISGSSIVVSAAESWISTGPPFGPDFDPERVELRPWGKFVLSFSDCGSGVMYYRSNDLEYGNGSLNLQRLSQIEALDCDQPRAVDSFSGPQDEFQVTAAISGAWYDPGHDGEGWLLEIIGNDEALLAWFSYGPDGEQAWFYNTGTIRGSTIEFDLLIPSGTDFGPTFDPDEVNRPVWGRATFTFDSCNNGSMSYDSTLEEYGSGNLELVRLTRLSGQSCQ